MAMLMHMAFDDRNQDVLRMFLSQSYDGSINDVNKSECSDKMFKFYFSIYLFCC